MSFNDLKLNQTTLNALQKSGYKHPTPIQAQAIPIVLKGKDLIATAQTGTGKTAAFVLPALEYLISNPPAPGKLARVLILAPVRELATQITDAIHKYSSHARVKVASILGGMPYHAQMRQLSQPLDIIVATPGRLIDYLERGKLDLSHIKMLVLDEADRMLDMGFIEDVKVISRFLPKQRQTLLFTATMDEPIRKLAQTLLHNPEHITIAGSSVTIDKIKQIAYIADDLQHKNKLLAYLLENTNIYKAIIFTATKRSTDQLAMELNRLGYHANALHGDIKQQKRNNILRQFRKGEIQFLVATDVAARGIDISDITHVINYDIPRTGEDYVHRIGRTGRAGREGIAISLINSSEGNQLKRIERIIASKIPQTTIAGLEPRRALHSEHKPKKHRGGSGRYHGKPAHAKSGHAKPAHSRFGHAKPAHAKSDHGKAAHTKSGHAKPAHAKSDHAKSAHVKHHNNEGYKSKNKNFKGHKTKKPFRQHRTERSN